MGRNAGKAVKEIEKEFSIWKELQAKHVNDIPFFHYSQGKVDQLESKLDIVSRLEMQNGNL